MSESLENRLRQRAKVVYLACEESVAADLSAHLLDAAKEIEYWKERYIDARKSGYQEGLEEAPVTAHADDRNEK